jgi:hypothetical protein
MELKVHVDSSVRIVCGLNEHTTVQDVIIALARSLNQTGRFYLIEKKQLLVTSDKRIDQVDEYDENNNEDNDDAGYDENNDDDDDDYDDDDDEVKRRKSNKRSPPLPRIMAPGERFAQLFGDYAYERAALENQLSVEYHLIKSSYCVSGGANSGSSGNSGMLASAQSAQIASELIANELMLKIEHLCGEKREINNKKKKRHQHQHHNRKTHPIALATATAAKANANAATTSNEYSQIDADVADLGDECSENDTMNRPYDERILIEKPCKRDSFVNNSGDIGESGGNSCDSGKRSPTRAEGGSSSQHSDDSSCNCSFSNNSSRYQSNSNKNSVIEASRLALAASNANDIAESMNKNNYKHNNGNSRSRSSSSSVRPKSLRSSDCNPNGAISDNKVFNLNTTNITNGSNRSCSSNNSSIDRNYSSFDGLMINIVEQQRVLEEQSRRLDELFGEIERYEIANLNSVRGTGTVTGVGTRAQTVGGMTTTLNQNGSASCAQRSFTEQLLNMQTINRLNALKIDELERDTNDACLRKEAELNQFLYAQLDYYKRKLSECQSSLDRHALIVSDMRAQLEQLEQLRCVGEHVCRDFDEALRNSVVNEAQLGHMQAMLVDIGKQVAAKSAIVRALEQQATDNDTDDYSSMSSPEETDQVDEESSIRPVSRFRPQLASHSFCSLGLEDIYYF